MTHRLATENDLPFLKDMYDKVIKNLKQNGINIYWNEYYPYEEFEEFDIKNKNLYLLEDENQIVAAVGIYESANGSENFNWKTKSPALYIARLAVAVDFLRKGYGSKLIETAKQIAKEKSAKSLRLMVVETNKPAILLYEKNGFSKADGLYSEYSPTNDVFINEIAYETKL